jgi:polyamine oxidase
MALYADPERGRYPVWQSLDHENFFPGSGIIFVTVTVSSYDLYTDDLG